MKFAEECGVFGGVAFKHNIAPYIQQGLLMLQHRGQESAGICCGDKDLFVYKNKGLVMEALNDRVVLGIKGKAGIGHNRYATQGLSDSLNAQPHMVRYLDEKVAVAHNGNVSSAMDMKREYEKQGEVFLTLSDTEMLLKKVIKELCKPPSRWTIEEIGKILDQNFRGGAWSILFSFPGKIMAFRDPLGYRPLFLCEASEGYFVGSEDSSFQLLDVKKVIEIEAGEAVEITENGYNKIRFSEKTQTKMCVFEHIYFSRPDSNVFGRNVYMTRVELGKRCSQENPAEADMVVPVLDSGFAAAIGFSQASNIPLHMGLMRNRWIGRSFIQPDQEQRKNSVIKKLVPIAPLIKGKSLVLIDDSIVRGTTSREIVRMLKRAGAKEVHFRLASPKIVDRCLWGVNIPTKKELIANEFKDTEGIRSYIEAESLGYLSLEGLKDIFGKENWCYYCMTKGNPK